MTLKAKLENAFKQLFEAAAISLPPPLELKFLESRDVPKIVLPCVIIFVSSRDRDIPVQSGNSDLTLELVLRTRADAVSELHDQFLEWVEDLVYVEVNELIVTLSDFVSDFTVSNVTFGQDQYEIDVEGREFLSRMNLMLNCCEVD